MTNLVVYATAKYYLEYEMKDFEMGRTCGMYREKLNEYRDVVGKLETTCGT